MADKAFNQPNELQRTALHAAAVHGRVDVVQFLLDVGADPNSQDVSAPPHGLTPVALASHAERTRLTAQCGCARSTGTRPSTTQSFLAKIRLQNGFARPSQ
eukprot:1007996-Rhodomonas_salina.1